MSNQPPQKDPRPENKSKISKAKKAADSAHKQASAKGKKKPNKEADSDAAKQGLDNFRIGIDAFGTVHSNLPVDAINRFLDKKVDDRKLTERDGPHADDAASPGEND